MHDAILFFHPYNYIYVRYLHSSGMNYYKSVTVHWNIIWMEWYSYLVLFFPSHWYWLGLVLGWQRGWWSLHL